MSDEDPSGAPNCHQVTTDKDVFSIPLSQTEGVLNDMITFPCIKGYKHGRKYGNTARGRKQQEKTVHWGCAVLPAGPGIAICVCVLAQTMFVL